MKYLLGATPILLCLALSATAQVKTDWERDGLKGRVRTLSTNIADVKKEGGRQVEKRRGSQLLVTYSADGRKVGIEARRGDEVNAKSTLTRDAGGRMAELFTCLPDTNEPFSKVVYSYDSDGNLVESASYVSDAFRGGLVLGTPETLVMKIVYSHDGSGRVAGQTVYAVGEKVISRSVYSHDAKGDLVGSTEYDSEGRSQVEVTYSYEFDAAGNWIKQTRFERKGGDGERLDVPVEITYRTITYY